MLSHVQSTVLGQVTERSNGIQRVLKNFPIERRLVIEICFLPFNFESMFVV